MASEISPSIIRAEDHQGYMELALSQARLSPPAPTKFCVGAVLVDADKNEVLSTGYSMELPGDRPGDPGNTHAEHCCFIKIAERHGLPEDAIGQVLPKNTVLYTTMEPCSRRLSGNRSCVDRVLSLKGAIGVVYVGIKEPGTFIENNDGFARLEDVGVKVVLLDALQEKILAVSTAGHDASTT
ncbi:cytidine deaminase-like protein [Xylariaceae sp. FL0255]|nr:cytidine deaminase-like protein [Xylariaceae sp. FL0255]